MPVKPVRQFIEEGAPSRDRPFTLALGAYGVEYQPIVDVRNETTVGYEALARFWLANGRPAPPARIFSVLHNNPASLAHIETQTKALQIRVAPEDGWLFVNLDPDAMAFFNRAGADNPFLAMLQARGRLVVELIENTDATSVHTTLEAAEALRSLSVPIAMDDVGAPDSVVSLHVMRHATFLKLDRYWMTHRADSGLLAMLEGLIRYAHDTGKQIIQEGVESAEDLRFCRNKGVDFAQGFLFRGRFIRKKREPATPFSGTVLHSRRGLEPDDLARFLKSCAACNTGSHDALFGREPS